MIFFWKNGQITLRDARDCRPVHANMFYLSVNDEPSQRQYRKGRSEAAADESIDAKSAMEEDEDIEIIEMYEEKSPARFVAPMKRASDKNGC